MSKIRQSDLRKNSVPANQNRCQSLFILMNIVRHAEIASEHVIIWL